MKPANFGGATNDRRITALNTLKIQISSGMKQPKGTILSMDKELLTADDIKRINKEISVLSSRIVSKEVAIAQRTKKYRGGGIR